MKLSDFKLGQKVYILDRHTGYNKAPEIIETTVTNIGRKYVYVSYNNRKYGEWWNDCCGLVEVAGYERATELFPTKEQAQEQIERIELIGSIRKNIDYLSYCSLEELRQINSCLR